MSAEEKIQELNLKLPEPKDPVDLDFCLSVNLPTNSFVSLTVYYDG